MGRIFDAVSALLGVYEGEPAQKLQMIAENSLEKGNFADNITINESTVSTRDIIQNIVELLNKGYEIKTRLQN